MTYAILYLAAMAMTLAVLTGCASSKQKPSFAECMTGPDAVCYAYPFGLRCNEQWSELWSPEHRITVKPLACLELDANNDGMIDLRDVAESMR